MQNANHPLPPSYTNIIDFDSDIDRYENVYENLLYMYYVTTCYH